MLSLKEVEQNVKGVISKEAQMWGVGVSMLVPTIVMGALQQPVGSITGAFIAGFFIAVAVHLRSNKVRAKKLAK